MMIACKLWETFIVKSETAVMQILINFQNAQILDNCQQSHFLVASPHSPCTIILLSLVWRFVIVFLDDLSIIFYCQRTTQRCQLMLIQFYWCHFYLFCLSLAHLFRKKKIYSFFLSFSSFCRKLNGSRHVWGVWQATNWITNNWWRR